MTDKPDYIRVTSFVPPAPPAQARVIRSDISHSMPAGQPVIWLGELAPVNLVSNSMGVDLSHAI